MNFSAAERAHNLERMAGEPFDVLVVGGGITGAGVALDAASQGFKTALVERDDFASGTSSKSSKLVHGGLRYLQQREFLLVYEALAERQRLLKLAPHIVHPLPFLIPVFATGRGGAAGAKAIGKAVNTALWMYDGTGGARIGKLHKKLSLDETREHMPGLRTDRLAAGYLYYDAQADDARLTLAITKTAALDHGAVVANYAPVTQLCRAGGRIVGAEVRDRFAGPGDGTSPITVHAGVVVNATGVWSDELRTFDEGAPPGTIRPAKGVHISVPFDRLPTDIAAVLPVPKDRRSIFVIPWGDRVYIGTTDTDYDGDIDHPVCTATDIDYLITAVNTWITDPITVNDVLGTWAGLRPLVRDARSERTADLSRRHSVQVSASGLVTVTGGKLTTYRRMAADAVEAAAKVLDRRARSRTARIPLFGADGLESLREPDAADRLGVDADVLDHLTGRYGGHARAVAAMVRDDAALGRPLVPTLPYLAAEALYAVRYEMAMTLEDVLARRTRALLLGRDAAVAAAPEVADLMGAELGWSSAERTDQVGAFVAQAQRERDAALAPLDV
jgi:glycerol-3-phosphate dehydrogenase